MALFDIPIWVHLFLILGFIPFPSIRIYQLHRIPRTIGIRADAGVLVTHRVHAQPHGHQLVIHIPCAEIAVACLTITLLTIIYYIQRCSPPPAGAFACESNTVLYAVFNHHQQDNEDEAVLLLQVPYRFSTLLPGGLQILILNGSGLQIQTSGTVWNIRRVGYLQIFCICS